MKKKVKNNQIVFVAIAIILCVIIWTIWGNSAIQLNKITVTSEDIPKSFVGYKIAQVSDLHNAEFGKDNIRLIELLEEGNPDIIVVTGDVVDSRKTDIEVATKFFEQAVKIAPCYYVTGNHESRISEYQDLESNMLELGVIVLRDAYIEIEKNEEIVKLIGLDDPSFSSYGGYMGESESHIFNTLSNLMSDNERYNILLMHRPELLEIYKDAGVDLVFTGHAHGGQIRLPFIGGIVAPNQGFFPKYDSGLYSEEDTNMIVSRGLGNSIIPLRVNNRPEVILVELQN